MARSPVLTGSTLSPFGGGGGGFGAFSIVNPGRESYLEFLKVKIDWQNGQVSNADYLAAYELYVGKQKEGSTTRLEAEQSLAETRYRLGRNELVAAIEAGTADWDDLVDYDKAKIEGLNHSSQEYIDRLGLLQQTQARAMTEKAEEQHALYEAGKLTTAQLRAWYIEQGSNPDLALNPDLADSIAKQVSSLDLRLSAEADQHMIELYQDGKVGTDAFLAYATAAEARYSAGTEDRSKWTEIIDDAKAQIAERGLTYRYGLSQDYIQLQKYIKDQKEMLAKAGSSSTSSSTRIVLGADGQWKTVTSTSSSPYKPSAAEVKAMAQRRIELASAEKQLATWTSKITSSGGFVSTDQMIGFYSSRQAGLVKGTDEWYQLQARIDGLEQQKFQEQVLAKEGVRITFGTGSGPSVGTPGTGTRATASGGGGGVRTTSGTAAPTSATAKPAAKGPLEVVTGYKPPTYVAGSPIGGGVTTQRSKFPTNLDGSAFLKFYSGFVAAYQDGATTFTDYSSGQPVTYFLPEDPALRVAMIGEIDDLRISYYATRAVVYQGTPSEITAAKEYSDAIKDKADNAYTILITEAKGGQILPTSTTQKAQPYGGSVTVQPGAIVNPLEQGTKVVEQAKLYYTAQIKAAEAAWARGDVTGAWAHLQLATRTAAETEAKVRAYVSAAENAMSQIYAATGEAAPDDVMSVFADLTDWTAAFAAPKAAASKLTDEVYKWVRLGSNEQPALNADGTLSLHDGAALILSPDGKVKYDEVASAGYDAPGSQTQIAAMPGYARVVVNLGGTVPNQTVYAKWEIGPVGYTADGQPIQGKIISGFLNGQRYTLVENPFQPGKWSAANQALKVPSSFKPLGDGSYVFTADGNQYLMVFDPKAGRYNIVKPAGPLGTLEQSIPIGEADAQALINGAGFAVDLSQIAPADRWKFNQTGGHVGFTKDQYQKFTMPPQATFAGKALDDIARPGLNNAWAPGTTGTGAADAADRARAFAAASNRLPFLDEQREIADAKAQFSIRKPMVPNQTVSGAPPEQDTWYADQQQQQAAAALARTSAITKMSSLDAVPDILAPKAPAVMPINTTVKPATVVAPKTTTSLATARAITTATKATTTTTAPRTTTTVAPKTTAIAPLPKISTTKLAAITRLAE